MAAPKGTRKKRKKGKPKPERLERKVFLNQRKLLIEGAAEAAKFRDKAILTVSTGVFALSMASVEYLVEGAGEISIFILKVSYTALLLAILTQLASFSTSEKAFENEKDSLDLEYEKGKKLSRTNKANTWTGILNWVAVVSFGIGFVSLFVFVVGNIPKGG